MTIDETIAHVLKLSETATAGPWEPRPSTVSIGRTIQGSAHGPLVDSPEKARADADLIASYRTLCPKMARALQVAVEALRKLEKSLESAEWDVALGALIEIQKEFES